MDIREPDRLIIRKLYILSQLRKNKLLENKVYLRIQEKITIDYIDSLEKEDINSSINKKNYLPEMNPELLSNKKDRNTEFIETLYENQKNSHFPNSRISEYHSFTSNTLDIISQIHLNKPIKIKVFLASSSELEADRRNFEIYISRQNNSYIDQGFYIEVKLWENFLDAMSQSRLQDEYNKTAQNCEIFISLFCTKVGKYTEEEFTRAFDAFKDTGKPLIYTYFKNVDINTADLTEELVTLINFKKKLKILGHYLTPYTSTSDLLLHFGQQLQKCLPQFIDSKR